MNPTDAGRDFIAHYGIKGMRWGVRRSNKQLESAAAKKDDGGESSDSNGAGSKSSTKNSRGNTKSLNDLNDKELKDVVNRMNMEKQYKSLQPTPLSKKAASFVVSASENAAKQVLTTVIQQQLSNQMGSLMTAKKKSN